jgi:hypothetical protein
VTEYLQVPVPTKPWLYPTDAEKRPVLQLVQRWQPYVWNVPAANLRAAELADYQLMSHCGRLRANGVRMPLRIAGMDCGGELPA